MTRPVKGRSLSRPRFCSVNHDFDQTMFPGCEHESRRIFLPPHSRCLVWWSHREKLFLISVFTRTETNIIGLTCQWPQIHQGLVFFVSSVSLSFFVVVLFVTGKEKMADITLKKFSVVIIITILWLKNLSVRETFLELRYLVVQRTCISLKWVLYQFYWKNNKSSKSFSTIHSSF